MNESMSLCLWRIILPASIALLCACDRAAPRAQDDTGEDTTNAAEDTPDAGEDPGVEEDASDAAEDSSDASEEAAQMEDASAAEDASTRDAAPVQEDAAEPADAAAPKDAGEVVDADRPAQPVFLPWKEGNSWTYRVTNKGKVSTKVVTVMAEERVGGSGPHADEQAFKVVTKKGALDQTVSWQALRGDAVVRFREQSFHADTGALELEEHWDPYKLHFDGSAARVEAGATWFEEYEETKLPSGASPQTSSERDRWLVDSPEEKVTVPAGTFRAVVVMKAAGAELKTYWYAPGVGKVKETGGQTEELVSYEVGE